MNDHLKGILAAMSHSRVRNYATPGLTSHLIGGGASAGKVRMFTCDRDTRDWIAPHSHRYDFVCLVLGGAVLNLTYTEVTYQSSTSNAFCRSTLALDEGTLTRYVAKSDGLRRHYEEKGTEYREGDFYAMEADDIHSIEFHRNAHILFFEGPEVRETSIVLEPYSDGACVPTFHTPPWMFQS